MSVVDREFMNQFKLTLREARAGQRTAVPVILSRRRGLKTVRRLVEIALERAASCSQRVLKLAPAVALRPVACHSGCATCCMLKVGVLAPEAITIAEHLRSHFDPTALADLRTRIVRLDDLVHGLDEDDRAGAQELCVLLADGLCSIYPVRPFACRWTTSPDVEMCLDTFVRNVGTGVSVDMVRMLPWREVLDGLRDGLEDAGLDGQPLEMTAALRIALDEPEAAERWLAGDTLFAYAHPRPTGKPA